MANYYTNKIIVRGKDALAFIKAYLKNAPSILNVGILDGEWTIVVETKWAPISNFDKSGFDVVIQNHYESEVGDRGVIEI